MTNASEGKFYPEISILCVMSANTDIYNESWQEGNKKTYPQNVGQEAATKPH